MVNFLNLKAFMCNKCGSSELEKISNKEWQCLYCRTKYYQEQSPQKEESIRQNDSILDNETSDIEQLSALVHEEYNPWEDPSQHLKGKLALVLFVIFIWIIVIFLFVF